MKEKGMARTVIILATSDRPAIERIKCCYTGIAIAEYFRDQGKDVMMIVDTLIRFAMAQREIGLARGEKPETKGYTPSVFTVSVIASESSAISLLATRAVLYLLMKISLTS